MKYSNPDIQAKYELDMKKWDAFLLEIKAFVAESAPQQNATSSELPILEGRFRKLSEYLGRLPFVYSGSGRYLALAEHELYEKYSESELSPKAINVIVKGETSDLRYVHNLVRDLRFSLRDVMKALQSCSSLVKVLAEFER
jgi:hypothetical protein